MNNKIINTDDAGPREGSIFIVAVFVVLGFLAFPCTCSAAQPHTNYAFRALRDSSSGAAAPLADFKPGAEKMFKQFGYTKKKWIAGLPSKADLGVPVYPGALIVAYQSGYKDDKEKLLPELVLVSSDPPQKIESWYASRLKGWKHIKNYHAFIPHGKNVDVMSDEYNATPHVEIEKSMSKNQFQGMFMMPPDNTKSGIIIRFK